MHLSEEDVAALRADLERVQRETEATRADLERVQREKEATRADLERVQREKGATDAENREYGAKLDRLQRERSLGTSFDGLGGGNLYDRRGTLLRLWVPCGHVG